MRAICIAAFRHAEVATDPEVLSRVRAWYTDPRDVRAVAALIRLRAQRQKVICQSQVRQSVMIYFVDPLALTCKCFEMFSIILTCSCSVGSVFTSNRELG